MIEPNHITLYLIKFLYRNTCHWPFCDTCVFFFLNTYDDVSSANVIKIISESTNGAINFIWIPSCFKLNTGGFYFTLMKQVFYVYRNSHLDILI